MPASPAEETVEEFAVRNGLEVFVEGINIEIGEKLGEGGQADVNKAKLIPSGELVAVKQYEISEHYEAGGHEGIVKLLGVYATSVNSRKQRGIVLEYCAGGSLDKVIEDNRQQLYPLFPMYLLPCLETFLIDEPVGIYLFDFYQISWIVQITAAVKHIHDLGIIHRDLKPANILFTSTDFKTLKICDFSDCTTLPKESAVVEHTSNRGTSGYRDIEIEAGRDYGNKADVFSLGRTIFCILFKITPETVAADPTNKEENWKLLFQDLLETFEKPNPNSKYPTFECGGDAEDAKKMMLILFKIIPEVATLAGRMYSTDVAERPTMDAACVRLQKILDDNRPIMNGTTPRLENQLEHYTEFLKASNPSLKPVLVKMEKPGCWE